MNPPGYATRESTLCGQVSMDVVHIEACWYNYLIVACDDLLRWVEVEALVKPNSVSVTCFFTESWVQRHGLCGVVLVASVPEFHGDLIN